MEIFFDDVYKLESIVYKKRIVRAARRLQLYQTQAFDNRATLQSAVRYIWVIGQVYRFDFRRSLVSGLPSPRRDGWTRELQTVSVT